MYQRGTASLKRLNEIFEVEPEINDKEADLSIKALQGNIEIRDLTFRYAKNLPLVFDHISTSV
jgi:ATP-binding cassette subfamily B protein